MRTRAVLTTTLVSLTMTIAGTWNAAAQESTSPPGFPIAEFQAREQTARWLLRYYRAALKAASVLSQVPAGELEKLGPEWYCVETERSWDCYYGRYQPAADRYDVMLHLQSSDGGEFARVATMPTPAEIAPYGRAVYRASQEVRAKNLAGMIGFSPYVRKTSTNEIEVWVPPVLSPEADGTLFYGSELCQTFDATGANILASRFTFHPPRSGKPDRNVDLRLDNEDDDVATVGNIFVLLLHGDEFKTASVAGRRFVTSLASSGGGQTWVHAERKPADRRHRPRP